MSIPCIHTNPLQREGTAQVQRLLDKLIPENVKLHELSEVNWLAFAREYAALIKFYELKDAHEANGDWEQFFPDFDEIEETLSKTLGGTIEPHLALFIAFLKLLAYPQKSLNGIPKRHLDFYYREVLRLNPQDFVPDTVHVIYELAKNASAELIPEDSQLEAGKDSEGNPLRYSTTENFVPNQVSVAAIHAFYKRNDQLLFANNPQTKDGLEEELDEGENWSAFGNNTWSNAPLELALTGSILRLNEGSRTITIHWDFEKKLELSGALFVSLTTEDGWTEEVGTTVSGLKNHIWSVRLPPEIGAITPLDPNVHEVQLDTSEPVVKFRFEDPDMFAKASNIQVKGITIDIAASGIKQLEIENELGKQLPDKPFMPFGPRPKKNSTLGLKCGEFLGKDITSFNIHLNWLNTPPNFTNHYSHYADAISAEKSEENNNLGYVLMYNYALYSLSSEEQTMKAAPMVLQNYAVEPDPMRDSFKLAITSPYQNGEKEVKMFTALPQIEIESDKSYLKNGEIELRLMESFYHHLYNNIYVSVVSKSIWTGVEPQDLPREPYTPLVDSVSLDYSATASITFGDNSISGGQIQFLHLTPFGSKKVTHRDSLMYPVQANSLFIGLSKAKARDIVSILFQVAEGSENPLLSSFSKNEDISWSVLNEQNLWYPLDEQNILKNTTNNFLRSGIITFDLPAQSSSNHDLFASNWIWLRAELKKSPDAIARFVGVHTQASTATFANQTNTFDHLSHGLPPGSIKQLAERKSRVKTVQQPYPSFGGKGTESDHDFYTRVSERLRHKDRAVTIWDYEHLTLQEFPNLYKVKCLNHTRFYDNKVDELAPGHITMVVLPKISDANQEHRLYPTVSQNIKDEIKAFLSTRKIMHAELEVVNPQYELVEFDFQVRFQPGYDYNFYRQILEQDLIAMLAPWAFDDQAEIAFNNKIYSYSVVNFIENLEYVDYLEKFIMNHYVPNQGWEPKKSIQPSSSLGILAPKKTHKIKEAINC